MPTGQAGDRSRRVHESSVNLPVIHRLGMERIPVDESSDKSKAAGNGGSVGSAPMVALALRAVFSTRLFEWP